MYFVVYIYLYIVYSIFSIFHDRSAVTFFFLLHLFELPITYADGGKAQTNAWPSEDQIVVKRRILSANMEGPVRFTKLFEKYDSKFKSFSADLI